MKPKTQNKRQQFPGGKYVSTINLNDWAKSDDIDNDNIFVPMDFEDVSSADYDVTGDWTSENYQINPNQSGDDENRRIEALKRAIDIAKLMNNVNVANIIAIASAVDKYLTK